MISISYTITPTITDHLVAIDRYRRLILTTPIAPNNERSLRWQAIVDHVHGSLALFDTPTKKSQVIWLLTHPSKQPTATERTVLSVKQTLDWIHESWTANPKLITLPVLETLVTHISRNHKVTRALDAEVTNLRHLLTYLSSQSDHPLLMAGIAQGQLASLSLDTLSYGLVSRLTAALILSKYGYDCRGLMTLTPAWTADPDRYDHALASITKLGQLTAWLEYYTSVAEIAYEGLSATITHAAEGIVTDLPAASWQLSTREEHILVQLEIPTNRITNRDVQHTFRISPVTASRDLTHLLALGLLYAHGKGRSVYYTKA